jgi:O-antigen/teichoic acid export membrane protein
MGDTRARQRAMLMAPLAPARILWMAWLEWRRAATHGDQLSMTTNSLFLIVAKVVSLGIGFLCWLAAARLFPASDVGLASTTVSATVLVALFAILGIGWSVIGMFQGEPRPNELLNSAISLVGVATLAASVAFLVVVALALSNLRVLAVDPRFAVCFIVFAVTGTLGVVFDQISTVMRRGDQAMTRNLMRGLVTLLVIPAALLVSESDRSLTIVAAWTAGSVVMIAIGTWQFSRRPLYYQFRPRLRLALAKPLLVLGMPNQVLNLAQRLPGTVLPIVVTQMISTGDSAIWYGAWMMASVVFFIPIQIGMTLYAELSYEGAPLGRLSAQALRLSLGVGGLTAIVAAAIAGPALSMLGHGYAAGGEAPFRIVVIAIAPMTVIEVYCAVCRGTQHMGEAVATGLVSAIASLAATVLVAPRYGLTGIACAWLLVQTVTGVWAALRLAYLIRGQPQSKGPEPVVQPTSQ